ncbi:MAG: flagellar motor protein MotB [Oscillospiraceae bacterium]|nr:flagellar motor protein MotB [Oscillospiraceae bacterium]
MAREKKPKEAPKGCPEWLATYGDMVTLVLTFFVLLFAFSSIDAEKWKTVVSSLTGNPSLFDGLDYSPNPVADQPFAPGAEITEVVLEYLMTNADTWEELEQMLRELISSANAEGTSLAQMESNATQIKINLSGDVLFDSGSDVLKAENLSILEDIIEEIRPYLPIIGFIVIEGHTDNVPINTARFPSNWELSQGRSAAVWRFLRNGVLAGDPDFPPRMFKIAGYGEEWPIDTNATPEGRQNNRRVTFSIDKTPDPLSDEPQTVSPDDIP